MLDGRRAKTGQCNPPAFILSAEAQKVQRKEAPTEVASIKPRRQVHSLEPISNAVPVLAQTRPRLFVVDPCSVRWLGTAQFRSSSAHPNFFLIEPIDADHRDDSQQFGSRTVATKIVAVPAPQFGAVLLWRLQTGRAEPFAHVGTCLCLSGLAQDGLAGRPRVHTLGFFPQPDCFK